MADKRAPVTLEIPFFDANIQKQSLFAVRAGVPASDALNWASCWLFTAIKLLEDISDENPEAHAAQVLMEMAKAAMDAVEVSHG